MGPRPSAPADAGAIVIQVCGCELLCIRESWIGQIAQVEQTELGHAPIQAQPILATGHADGQQVAVG